MQAQQGTEAHFTATVAAKAAALRINLNIEGCGVVAPLNMLLLAVPFSPGPWRRRRRRDAAL